MVSVSSSSAPVARWRDSEANERHDPAPHQRLAAGEPQLAHAARDEGAAQPVELLERQQVGLRQERHVLRHAVDAAEVAAVGHRDAQIGDARARTDRPGAGAASANRSRDRLRVVCSVVRHHCGVAVRCLPSYIWEFWRISARASRLASNSGPQDAELISACRAAALSRRPGIVALADAAGSAVARRRRRPRAPAAVAVAVSAGGPRSWSRLLFLRRGRLLLGRRRGLAWLQLHIDRIGREPGAGGRDFRVAFCLRRRLGPHRHGLRLVAVEREASPRSRRPAGRSARTACGRSVPSMLSASAPGGSDSIRSASVDGVDLKKVQARHAT